MRIRTPFLMLSLVALLLFAVGCGDDEDANGGGGGRSATPTTEAASIPYKGPESRLATEYPAPEKASITIGWSNPLGANESLSATQRTLKAWTEHYGGRLISLDAQGDPNKQVSDIAQLIARRVDVIVVFPLDAHALDPMLERAKRRDIPVIGVEVEPDGGDPSSLWASQVIQRRDFQAYTQAKYAARKLPAGAEVGLLGFAVKVPSLEYYQERQRYWAGKFGLDVAGAADNDSDDIAGGAEAMTRLLSQAPDIEGVLSYNEESAVGAASSARQAGKRDMLLVGTNGGSLGYSSVKSGKIDATVQLQIASLGKLLAEGAFDAAAGTKIPRTVMTAEPQLITKETLEDVPTWEESRKQQSPPRATR